MDHPLDGITAKLERADAHLQELNAQIPGFIARTPHRFDGRIDLEARKFIVKVWVNEQPPIEWSVIVGDFIHNLRSALDHLITQLIIRSGATPKTGPGGNQFPIFTSKPGDMRRRTCSFNRQLLGVTRYGRALINRFQPYHAGKEAHSQPLAVLAELSNEDKHQAIVPSVAAIPSEPLEADEGFDVVDSHNIRIEQMEVLVNRPLADGDVAMTADVEVLGPDPRLKIRGDLPFEVAFGRSMVRMSSLITIRDAVHAVVATLEPVFPR